MQSQGRDVECENLSQAEWDRLATAPKFRNLVKAKKLFLIPAVLSFLAYYFSLQILLGCAPRFMSIRVFGVLNVAYVFGVSEIVVGWVVALLYVKAARNFDEAAKDILEKSENHDREMK